MKDKFERAIERKDMLSEKYNIPSSCIVFIGKDKFDIVKSKVIFRVQFANRNSNEIKQTTAVIAYRYQINETYVGCSYAFGYVTDTKRGCTYEYMTSIKYKRPKRWIEAINTVDHDDFSSLTYFGEEDEREGIYNAIVEYYKIKEA